MNCFASWISLVKFWPALLLIGRHCFWWERQEEESELRKQSQCSCWLLASGVWAIAWNVKCTNWSIALLAKGNSQNLLSGRDLKLPQGSDAALFITFTTGQWLSIKALKRLSVKAVTSMCSLQAFPSYSYPPSLHKDCQGWKDHGYCETGKGRRHNHHFSWPLWCKAWILSLLRFPPKFLVLYRLLFRTDHSMKSFWPQ